MYDDRTTHLNLPLPHGLNTLDEDVPRLRASFSALDTYASENDTALQTAVSAIGTEAERATGAEAALAARITGVEGKSARLNGFAFSFVVFDDPEAAGSEYTEQQAEVTAYALAQLGLSTVDELPPLIAVHNLNGQHLFIHNPASTEPPLLPWWADNGLDTVDKASLDTLGVVKLASVEQVAAGVDEENAVTPKTLKEGHDADADAHAAMVRRITVGDVSPVIGICHVSGGATVGLWGNCDADGQPVSPSKRFFDFHPVYDSMRTVLVDGQVMRAIDPFWFKHIKPESGPFAGKLCRIISPGQQDGFRPYPAFQDGSGELRTIYIGAYEATDEGGGKAGSRPGKLPLVNINFETMRTRCAARNVGGVAGFRLWDIYHYEALCNLFLIENATPESQGLYGRGHVDDTWDGTTSKACVTDDDRQAKWRGFWGLWGNVWMMVDGFRLTSARVIEMFRNSGTQTYVNTGKAAPSYGTAVAYMVSTQEGGGSDWDMEDGYFPMTQSINRSDGTFGDYFWGGNGDQGKVLYVGGDWNLGVGAGLFCAHLYLPASYAYIDIGGRLAK
jgi:hypothetical protein